METTGLRRKASELRDMPAAMFARPQRDMKRVAALWFIGGMALASLLGFFFYSRRGGERRHMAVDKIFTAGKDVKEKGQRQARQLRNKAASTNLEPVAATPKVD
jgi:hypothetical protein